MSQKKYASSIKYVMSDCHVVQKNFSSIFQEYRPSVLPDVVEGWD